MRRFGLVGLPNAGKSSLYNALTSADAHAAPYAFATTDPNVGVAKVPDARLGRLAEMSRSRSEVHAAVQFTDIGGLVEGAHQGEGLGNAFLAHIREVDAIVFVLRAFDGSEVPGDSDPLEQLRVLEIELALADLAGAQKALEKARRLANASRGSDKEAGAAQLTVEALERCADWLGEGVPLYRSGLDDDDRALLAPFFLLTAKPVLAVVNIGEDQLDRSGELAAPLRAELSDAEVIALCVQVEAEAAQLDAAERAEMLDAFELGDGAVGSLLAGAYHLLGLRTFLTTGEAESRAWTFAAGQTARECAGVIHSDFERGFIRAETIGCEELLESGSWAAARERGKVRSEGKHYLTRDGDVMEFRFSV